MCKPVEMARKSKKPLFSGTNKSPIRAFWAQTAGARPVFGALGWGKL
jgi:hypothetical protein